MFQIFKKNKDRKDFTLPQEARLLEKEARLLIRLLTLIFPKEPGSLFDFLPCEIYNK